MSNYALIKVRDALARLEGVGDVMIFGQQDYSMRVWLNPYRLTSRDLTAGDVVKALREQNVQVAAGQTGQPPAEKGVDFQYTRRAGLSASARAVRRMSLTLCWPSASAVTTPTWPGKRRAATLSPVLSAAPLPRLTT